MGEVPETTRAEIVEHGDTVALGEEAFDEMTADEASAAGDNGPSERPGHDPILCMPRHGIELHAVAIAR